MNLHFLLRFDFSYSCCLLQNTIQNFAIYFLFHFIFSSYQIVGPTLKTKDLKAFVQLDVVSLMEDLPTVNEANIAAMIHSVTVQYLYRGGVKENDTQGSTRTVSDVSYGDFEILALCLLHRD